MSTFSALRPMQHISMFFSYGIDWHIFKRKCVAIPMKISMVLSCCDVFAVLKIQSEALCSNCLFLRPQADLFLNSSTAGKHSDKAYLSIFKTTNSSQSKNLQKQFFHFRGKGLNLDNSLTHFQSEISPEEKTQS